MERIRELDGVRGLAAVVILIYHLRPGGSFSLGWAAVDVFFVLSGFLITSILLRHLNASRLLSSFYARRGLRIWPAYYLALAALVVVDRFFGDRLPLGYLPSFATFTQGLPWLAGPGREAPPYFGHTWTLAIEEQFYLLWPALVVVLGRRAVVPLAALFAAGSIVLRQVGCPPFLLVSRCDGFALGAIVASVLADPARVAAHGRTLRRVFGCGAALLLLYVGWREAGARLGLPVPPGSTSPALTPLFACAIALIVLESGRPALRFLRSAPLVHLGTISYGLYLYHGLVYFLVFAASDRLGFGPSRWKDALALLAAWLVAIVSWRYLERPLLAFKDRFPYGDRTPATARYPGFFPSAARPVVG